MATSIQARLAAWFRRHIAADDPDQGRSGWDELDHAAPPDGDASVTDAAEEDCG